LTVTFNVNASLDDHVRSTAAYAQHNTIDGVSPNRSARCRNRSHRAESSSHPRETNRAEDTDSTGFANGNSGAAGSPGRRSSQYSRADRNTSESSNPSNAST
jgi:hypothetical protein